MSDVSKKLVNEVNECARNCNEGLVAVHPGLSLVDEQLVVVRTDASTLVDSGKVIIISGGGSGHEPAFAGYVGKGHLTAAACGAVFASPAPKCILAAVNAVCQQRKNCSILIILANYTGDRLNFGIACERARLMGHKCEAVVVGEDCALTSVDHCAGRRGCAGIMFILKIAGAMVEQGKSLEEIVPYLNDVKTKMGTIGMSLSACSVPGSGPNFFLGPDEMELGLGLHGEAGVKRIKVLSAHDTVKEMMDHMTNPQTSTHININKGDRVAVLINNLGALSVLELHIVAKEAIEYLEKHGAQVELAYCGAYITSLEMAGVSITVLHIDEQTSEYLDFPSSAPAWKTSYLLPGDKVRKTPGLVSVPSEVHSISQEGAATLDTAAAKKVSEAIKRACERLVAKEATINDLDARSGDGDCGSTMARGAKAVLDSLRTGLPVHCPHTLALELGHILENTMGGTSGPLYSLFFTGVAQKLMTLDKKNLVTAVGTGLGAMMKYGGAKPGYRTMVDPLHAMYTTLKEQLNNVSIVEAIKMAAQACESSALATTSMNAQAGRASYVNKELLTKPDPGAIAVATWMSAVAEVL